MANPTYYDLLQVSPGASEAVIQAAFKTLSRAAFETLSQRHHADDSAGGEEARAHIERLNEAFEVLSNPLRRATYDLTMKRPKPSSSTGRPAVYATAAPLARVIAPDLGGSSAERPASTSRPGAEATSPVKAESTAPPPAADAKPAAPAQKLPFFWYVVLACFVGGRYRAIEISKHQSNGLDKLSFTDQMFSSQFWDVMTVPVGSLLLGAVISWFLARRVPWLKERASLVSLMVVLWLCYQTLG